MLVHTMENHGDNFMDTDKNMELKTQKARKMSMIQAKAYDLAEVSRFKNYEHKSLNEISVYSAYKQGLNKIKNKGQRLLGSINGIPMIYCYQSNTNKYAPHKASKRKFRGWIYVEAFDLYMSPNLYVQ